MCVCVCVCVCKLCENIYISNYKKIQNYDVCVQIGVFVYVWKYVNVKTNMVLTKIKNYNVHVQMCTVCSY